MKPNIIRSMIFFMIIMLLAALQAVIAQQPVFRIGVLDNERGPISNGARLAIQDINNQGGVRGADGSFFRLELIVQPTNFGVNLEEAVNNLNQANIIAALGPLTNSEVLNGLPLLQALNVPVITPAEDDTIIIADTTDRLFRSRAAQILSAQALANHLIQELRIGQITVVQLDVESTDKSIGFTSATAALGVNPQVLLLQADIPVLATSIIQADPQVAVVYGSPALASELYNLLREAGWTGRFAYDDIDTPAFTDNIPFDQLGGIIATLTWPFTALDEASEDFLVNYVRAFGTVPGEVEAASYDSVLLLAEAISRPGDLQTNLTQLDNVIGVQGLLRPAQLARGETSNNVAVVQLGAFGAPQVAGRYAGGVRLPDDVPPVVPAFTPTPEGVVATITQARQNIRTGPSIEYDVIAQASEGDQFQVIGATADNTWIVVDFRGRQGWLATYLLEVFGNLNTVPIIDPPPSPTPGFTPTPAPPQQADIIIESAAVVPSPIVPNQPFTVTVVLRNVGNSDAGPFSVGATFPPNNVFSAAAVPGLPRGQQTTVNLVATLNNTGFYTVTILADIYNQVPEGPGENNNAYNFSYVVDRPILTQGTRTLNAGDTLDLDGNGVADFQWTSTDVNALNGARIGILRDIPYENTHWDMISPGVANLGTISRGQLDARFVIGIITGDGKRGAIRVDDMPGSQMILTFKVYPN